MVRPDNDRSLIVEALCGLLLVGFMMSVMVIAAVMIGWAMVLGMVIAFCTIIGRALSHNS